ncbi:MAG: hypothetical protein KBD53_12300 [Candidatus Omnitrophica bacterium]|nr:hypothetical protein [Candidatus Omnitrophota bacterium]
MEQIHTSEQGKPVAHKTDPKDFFLHLFTMGLMYFSVGNFLSLSFEIINRVFPDTINTYGYYSSGFSSGMKFSIASLVVLFPLYLYLNNFLHKQYEKQPEKKEAKIRKWLIYFTLFVSAITLVGDLVYGVYSLLDGELSARFWSKEIIVLLTAAAVFYYYLHDIKKGDQVKTI